MFSTSFSRFLRDESGAYTVWSLVWFSLYVAMGGLAVDMTDAYRNQTLLQATADASALAGGMSLPNAAAVEAQALAYSTVNMDPAINGNGNVLAAADVIVGNWNFDTQEFNGGPATATTVDAVLVTTRRSNRNANPLATSFLRIINLWGIRGDVWNINTEAIAVRYVPGCLTDGFVSANWVDINGGNDYYNDICIHGQNIIEDNGQDYGVDLGNGNTFQGPTCDADGKCTPGVSVSTPYPDDDITNNNPTCGQNDGLCGPNGAKRPGDQLPADIGQLTAITAGLLDPTSAYIPVDMVQKDEVTEVVTYPTVVSLPNADFPGPGDKYAGPYDEYTIYDITCSGGNKTLDLPTDTEIKNVVIVADCSINAGSGVALKGVALSSTYAGNGPNGLSQNSINMAAGSILGEADDCADGGGVELYSAASIHIAAGGEWHGLRAVSVWDFKVTSNTVGVHGISVQAGNLIDMSSNNEFGLCAGGVPGVFAWHYRLVK